MFETEFKALISPNFTSKKTVFSDLPYYFGGLFLVILPFLPFPKLHILVAIFTFLFFSCVFSYFFLVDFSFFIRAKVQLLLSGFREFKGEKDFVFKFLLLSPDDYFLKLANSAESDSV